MASHSSSELDHLLAELKSRETELNLLSESHQNQLMAWQQDRHNLESLRHRNHELEQDAAVSKQELAQHKGQYTEMKESLELYVYKLQHIQGALRRLQQSNEELAKALTQKQAEVDAAYRQSRQHQLQFEQQQESHTAAEAKLKHQLELQHEELLQVQTSNQQLQARHVEHQQQHQRCQQQLNQAQGDISRLQQASTQDQATARGLRQQLEQCKQQLLLKARTIEELQQSLSDHKRSDDDVQAALTEMQAQIDRQQQLLQLSQSKEQRYTRELSSLNQVVDQSREASQQLQDELDACRAKLAEEQRNAANLVSQQRSSKSEAEVLKSSMLQLKQELEQEATRSLQASNGITTNSSPSPTQASSWRSSSALTSRPDLLSHPTWPQSTLNNYNEDPMDDVEAVLAATADLLARTKVQAPPS
eukprot:m.201691 g.201691  ORF g.201691 m.201691 type:complete len:419 (-) comp17058_c1_seq23:3371-4627(-)